MTELTELNSLLQTKGQNKTMLVSELTVQLNWQAAVDLDLMAFYRTKSGKTGGVYSSLYSEGGEGSLDRFPFIKLSGDAGVQSNHESKQETLTIKKFDELTEIYLVAINFTDASRNQKSSFSKFDGRVEVSNENNEKISVLLGMSARLFVAFVLNNF